MSYAWAHPQVCISRGKTRQQTQKLEMESQPQLPGKQKKANAFVGLFGKYCIPLSPNVDSLNPLHIFEAKRNQYFAHAPRADVSVVLNQSAVGTVRIGLRHRDTLDESPNHRIPDFNENMVASPQRVELGKEVIYLFGSIRENHHKSDIF